MDMSDEQLDENMRAIGQEVTEESKKTYRDALNMMVQMNLKGSMIETHTEALTLDLAPEDLVYSPPEGAEKILRNQGGSRERVKGRNGLRSGLYSSMTIPSSAVGKPTK